MWMELTEQEASYISKWARDRYLELTMLSLPATQEEMKAVKAIGEKALNVHYASSVRHTIGADALTPEAAQYIKQELEHLNDAHGPSWVKIRDGLDAVLEPYGLTLEALKYERGCGIALIGDVHA